jgi:hypothetical protein
VNDLAVMDDNDSDGRLARCHVVTLNRHINVSGLLHRGGDRPGDESTCEAGGEAAHSLARAAGAASTRLAIVVATRSFFIGKSLSNGVLTSSGRALRADAGEFARVSVLCRFHLLAAISSSRWSSFWQAPFFPSSLTLLSKSAMPRLRRLRIVSSFAPFA